MTKSVIALVFAAGLAAFGEEKKTSGNPIFEGWYADPEVAVFGDTYWVFPTYSAPFEKQLFLDCFSSKDLVNWIKHPRIIDNKEIKWLHRALWAPAAIEKDGKYYLFFACNDALPKGHPRVKEWMKEEYYYGGIGVAVADRPEGPYKDLLGKALWYDFTNGAQPIDQFVFKYKGDYLMVYGGWQHCNLVRLAPDFKSVIPFEDGTMVKEITPKGYVEGPIMFERNGKWYFMWSQGGWTNSSYHVAYAIADTPFGPFKSLGVVLSQDPAIATGAGHHSVFRYPGTDDWYIVYHRRPIPNQSPHHRVTCIDRMYFNPDGTIKPVVMTKEGVAARPLPAKR